MKSRSLSIIFMSLFFFLVSPVGANELPKKFDPQRNPKQDLSLALNIAKTTGKNILLDIGGYWCEWCENMEKWIHENTDVEKHLNANYVLLKVHFGKENRNEEFLSQFPEIPGYPHFFVLSSEGKLLHSQSTGELEKGKSYDKENFLNFLKKWSPEKSKK